MVFRKITQGHETKQIQEKKEENLFLSLSLSMMIQLKAQLNSTLMIFQYSVRLGRLRSIYDKQRQ